jgi:hypothetical protein
MHANHQEKTLTVTLYSLSAPRYNDALKELINSTLSQQFS